MFSKILQIFSPSRKREAKRLEQAKIAKEILGYSGRMIWGSKSDYQDRNPSNLVVFNANICTKTGKIWYGDVDITKESNNLRDLSVRLKDEIFVLYEMDGRFENEEKPLLNKAVLIVDGQLSQLGEKAKEYYYLGDDNKWVMKPEFLERIKKNHLENKPKKKYYKSQKVKKNKRNKNE